MITTPAGPATLALHPRITAYADYTYSMGPHYDYEIRFHLRPARVRFPAITWAMHLIHSSAYTEDR